MSGDPRAEWTRLFEAFNAGRADVIAEMYDEDSVLHLAGNNPISGNFRGPAAVREGLTNLFQRLAPPPRCGRSRPKRC